MSDRIRVLLALARALTVVAATLGFATALGSSLWQADGASLCVADKDQQAPSVRHGQEALGSKQA